MASPILDQLTTQVTNTTGVEASATTLINGFAQKLADGIAAALADGATGAQLQPLSDLSNAMQAGSDALAAAVAANSG